MKTEKGDHMKSFKITNCARMCYFHILSNFAKNCYVKSPSNQALWCALYETICEILAELGRLGHLEFVREYPVFKYNYFK